MGFGVGVGMVFLGLGFVSLFIGVGGCIVGLEFWVIFRYGFSVCIVLFGSRLINVEV